MSTAALLLDYLFVGPLIQARLRSQVEVLALDGAVQGVESLVQAIERNITAPTVFVYWEGDVFGDEAGTAQIVRQQWTALLAVRNATQVQADARNESAGPLLSAIHKAIAGWVPTGVTRPFKRAQGRKANFTANVGLYPLTFELPLHL